MKLGIVRCRVVNVCITYRVLTYAKPDQRVDAKTRDCELCFSGGNGNQIVIKLCYEVIIVVKIVVEGGNENITAVIRSSMH